MNRDRSWMSYDVGHQSYTPLIYRRKMTIDACVNHCVLFRKEFANEDKCPKCLAPRWKENIEHGGNGCSDDDSVSRKAIIDAGELQRDPQGTLRGVWKDMNIHSNAQVRNLHDGMEDLLW